MIPMIITFYIILIIIAIRSRQSRGTAIAGLLFLTCMLVAFILTK